MGSRPVRLEHNEKGRDKCERGEKNTMSSLIIQYMIAVLAGYSYVKSAGEEKVQRIPPCFWETHGTFWKIKLTHI